jgi:DNA adenine methylase
MTDDARPGARPFLKWPGGKGQLLGELAKHVPERFGRYYEPFVGGGALFFHLSAAGRLNPDAHAVLIGDQNEALIVTYAAVRDDVEPLIRALRRYARGFDTSQQNRERLYYATRAKRIATRFDVASAGRTASAARTIFLNRTCFNGLYRVNRSGGFNVPIGDHKNPTICDAQNLRACAAALAHTQLLVGDFEASSSGAARGDFWYADPPYVPLSASSDFTAYTKEPFGLAEQERLASLARQLKKKGVHVLLSNSNTPLVRKLYKGFSMRRVLARRNVNSRADRRGCIHELLIW